MGLGLKDKKGIEIEVGDIVEWNDAEGKRTAKVIFENGQVGFHCFKNSKPNWAVGYKFMIGSFMYADTCAYLTKITHSLETTTRELTFGAGVLVFPGLFFLPEKGLSAG